MNMQEQSKKMKPQILDHIVILVKDVKRTEKFYSTFLGKPIPQDNEQVAYQMGETKIFFALPYNKDTPDFNKENLGLNHLAFQVTSVKELEGYKDLLDKAKIKHSGIQRDKYSRKEFIWFDDPDGIRLEFYLRK